MMCKPDVQKDEPGTKCPCHPSEIEKLKAKQYEVTAAPVQFQTPTPQQAGHQDSVKLPPSPVAVRPQTTSPQWHHYSGTPTIVEAFFRSGKLSFFAHSSLCSSVFMVTRHESQQLELQTPPTLPRSKPQFKRHCGSWCCGTAG